MRPCERTTNSDRTFFWRVSPHEDPFPLFSIPARHTDNVQLLVNHFGEASSLQPELAQTRSRRKSFRLTI